MREILFKAKRLDNGEWVEGYVGYKGKGTEFEECDIMQSTFSETASPFAYPFYFTDIQVDPATVCQYTGLTDKNGVKIFEWDMLLYDEYEGIVYYREDDGMYVFDYDGNIETDFGKIWADDVEVIGNIHDKEG